LSRSRPGRKAGKEERAVRDEYYWAVIVLTWVFGWALIWLRRRRAREAMQLQRREMVHRERLAAIDKGVPLVELPSDEEEVPAWLATEIDRLRARWLLRLSLALGLVSVTSGLGLCLGFYWAPDRGFHGMWTLGLIPLMGGIGFLLFWRIASAWDRPT
jgi:hypothetical protein